MVSIPEEYKIAPGYAVVFKKHFKIDGESCNAIVQKDDGALVFFDNDEDISDIIEEIEIDKKEENC